MCSTRRFAFLLSHVALAFVLGQSPLTMVGAIKSTGTHPYQTFAASSSNGRYSPKADIGCPEPAPLEHRSTSRRGSAERAETSR